MSRYKIVSEYMDPIKGMEVIDINYDEIDPTHNYRNLYYYKNENDLTTYEQDKCLNKYDINRSILEYLKAELRYSKLWTIDPNYITLDTAIELAKIGQGKYIPKDLNDLWEISVLRYIAGERGFFDTKDNTSVKMSKVISEALEVSNNIDDYVNVFKLKNKDIIENEQEKYDIEEKRALTEEDQRLNTKMEYCLDIMKDITIAKTKVLELKK